MRGPSLWNVRVADERPRENGGWERALMGAHCLFGGMKMCYR